MVARDDSVIRGSLIASLIFLVLSLALNIFLWQWGDTQSSTAENAREQLTSTQNNLRELTDQASLMQAMLGAGTTTEAQFETLAASAEGIPEMEAILLQYQEDMSLFGQEVEAQNRNYAKLGEYLVTSIRSRNDDYVSVRKEVDSTRQQAQSDVENARDLQKVAEESRDAKAKELEEESEKFAARRREMDEFTEQARDTMNKTSQQLTSLKGENSQLESKLDRETAKLLGTIDNLRQENSRLRGDNFETAQGRVTSVVRGGNVVMVNLGRADELRPGVTFGVMNGDDTRLQDADVKATIQITRVLGDRVSEARVIARPQVRHPIVAGDRLYSPFWSPGRTVKIALAGDIDVDGDGKSDNEAIKGMIDAAGAEVVAEVSSEGVEGNLDASVRFMVLGEDPDIEGEGEQEVDEQAVQRLEQLGRFKSRANSLGITVLPAWKLESYLKTINDSLTTPLGSAVRGDDFPPAPNLGAPRQQPSAELPETYQRQIEGMQRGNEILRP